MGRGRGLQTPVTLPKCKTLLSRGATQRHTATIQRFCQQQANGAKVAAHFVALVTTFDILSEKRREQLRVLLRAMEHHNRELDKHWWKLPEHAYEGDLRFFDSDAGVRNVPLKKKKRPTFFGPVDLNEDSPLQTVGSEPLSAQATAAEGGDE